MPDKLPDPTSITLDGRVWQIHAVNWEEMTVELQSMDGRTSQTVSFSEIWGSQNTLVNDSGEAHPGRVHSGLGARLCRLSPQVLQSP